MRYETPTELLGRLRLGREEFCQRLLTSLITEGPYPRWNTRSTASERGARFLRAVYEDAFARRWPGDACIFVDEFEIRGRRSRIKLWGLEEPAAS